MAVTSGSSDEQSLTKDLFMSWDDEVNDTL
jgi:hypothetical protein